MSNGRSDRVVDLHALQQAQRDLAAGGSPYDAIKVLDAGGFAIDILGPEHIAALLGIDAAMIAEAVQRGEELEPKLERWHGRIGAARRAYIALRPHRQPDRIRTPNTARTARPRGRRERHIARSTSSGDSGDDGPGEPPPPPPDDPTGGRP